MDPCVSDDGKENWAAAQLHRENPSMEGAKFHTLPQEETERWAALYFMGLQRNVINRSCFLQRDRDPWVRCDLVSVKARVCTWPICGS